MKMKKLWFVLPVIGWVACRFLWIEAGNYITTPLTIDSFWWLITTILGSLLIIYGSVFIAIIKQD